MRGVSAYAPSNKHTNERSGTTNEQTNKQTATKVTDRQTDKQANQATWPAEPQAASAEGAAPMLRLLRTDGIPATSAPGLGSPPPTSAPGLGYAC